MSGIVVVGGAVVVVLVEVVEVVDVVVVVDVLVIVTVLGPVGVFVSQAIATLTISNPSSSGLRIPCVSGIGNSLRRCGTLIRGRIRT
jgi:hypothetical protein